MSAPRLMTLDEVEALENELGTFSKVVDQSDPRFEIITWKRVSPSVMGGPPTVEIAATGRRARAKALKFILASCCGYARSIGYERLARDCERIGASLAKTMEGWS